MERAMVRSGLQRVDLWHRWALHSPRERHSQVHIKVVKTYQTGKLLSLLGATILTSVYFLNDIYPKFTLSTNIIKVQLDFFNIHTYVTNIQIKIQNVLFSEGRVLPEKSTFYICINSFLHYFLTCWLKSRKPSVPDLSIC